MDFSESETTGCNLTDVYLKNEYENLCVCDKPIKIIWRS